MKFNSIHFLSNCWIFLSATMAKVKISFSFPFNFKHAIKNSKSLRHTEIPYRLFGCSVISTISPISFWCIQTTEKPAWIRNGTLFSIVFSATLKFPKENPGTHTHSHIKERRFYLEQKTADKGARDSGTAEPTDALTRPLSSGTVTPRNDTCSWLYRRWEPTFPHVGDASSHHRPMTFVHFPKMPHSMDLSKLSIYHNLIFTLYQNIRNIEFGWETTNLHNTLKCWNGD